MAHEIKMDRVVAHTNDTASVACDIVMSRDSVCGHGESSQDCDNRELHFEFGKW